MKSFIGIILFITVLLLSCSDDCENENPSVRLVNNYTEKADIQIKTSGGNTENVNNIQPGTASEKRAFAPGDIEFTVAIQGVNDPVVYNLRVYYCVDYTVTVNPDTTVSSSGRDRE